MNLETLSVLLLISLGFIVSGYFIRFDKNSNYLFINGFFVMIIAGVVLLVSPLEFISGSSVTTVGENIDIVYNYSPLTLLSGVLALVFSITGTWGVIASVTSIREWKEPDDE
jgi:hypothetical protein